MDANAPPFPEEFEQQVRACLQHLYDMTELQQQPLVRQLLPDTPALQRGQAFRRLIFRLLEALAPDTTAGSRQDRIYQILTLRYVEGQPNHEVSRRLSLSERQYYREYSRALQAITYLLWEQVNAQRPAMSVQSELQRAAASAESTSVDPADLLARVVEATQNLAEARGIRVRIHLPDPTPELTFFNVQAARQLLIMFLYQAIQRHAAHTPLDIFGALEPGHFVIRLPRPDAAPDLPNDLEQHPAFQELLRTLGGTISFNEADPSEAVIRLPAQQNLVLIIDDNPDAISLLQRYLGHTFPSVAAQQAEEGLEMARARKPWLIILDVMLPTMDGWEVLQNLKNHPDTHTIPVLVCSVLDTPDMALALGADGFLKKPPDQVEFLNTLAHWKASARRPPHPHS
jgi:CheY-like chemotaxis protein